MGRDSFRGNDLCEWIYLQKEGSTKVELLDGISRVKSPSISIPALMSSCQRRAAKEIAACRSLTTLVHGPPGTGKTTVIVATTAAWLSLNFKSFVLCVSQSSIAVMNMAEAFLKHNGPDFRIIALQELSNEHLSEGMKEKLVSSSDIAPRFLDGNLFKDGATRVILSTISMLNSDILGPIYDRYPPDLIIVDEANHVFTGDYAVFLQKFRRSLRHVAFFGDPMQLSPHASETIRGVYSVFDEKHLRRNGVLLDTSYRLPLPIAKAISSAYGESLKYTHEITSWRDCIRFIDVDSGFEEKQGQSHKVPRQCYIGLIEQNHLEAMTVVQLVNNYYANSNCAIITPYKAQRLHIADLLDKSNLATRCIYSADTFQGYEADIVIFSVVHTVSLGFLCDIRKLTVMLTRAKKLLIIVGMRRFVSGMARKTLLGSLVNRFNQFNGFSVDWKEVLHGKARLPLLL
ncbi:putative ATP-dependent RNA helicase ECM32 [Neolecta irregularis DAH-3]|uniref:Putative ATP-dependent RNA helicase ECM32 n=1 Tax=Neolecta irregularis (strain DAH-3) TaxID=1198029 RepID=A0A1U7LHQ8_NEOID|nr:putative ATP-dependent RNA helicase ECM32 [Neolecta irregularis DAH-3]|eukprot:OLL22061.1 putative ATP-dependent RNA helicase ECM32 [Neolecta irregularis DAH-3]